MKKLKGLGNRTYNVLFHTHTVSGIVISFALFVIFYAGAFSLFRHEVAQWENPDFRQELKEDIDIDATLAKIDKEYNIDFSLRTNIQLPNEERPVFSVYGTQKTQDSTKAFVRAFFNPATSEIQDIETPKTTVSDTIYFLHYFRQIPIIGLYLSGFVALFFLFASITGVLIHWRNILTKFYAFVKQGKWKMIWTNIHTVLGVIGLPFQIMYAVTGAFYGLLTFILLPVVFLQFGGDASKATSKVLPFNAVQVDPEAPDADHLSLNELSQRILAEDSSYKMTNIQVMNYGKEDAIASFNFSSGDNLHSAGTYVFTLLDGKLQEEYSMKPNERKNGLAIIDYIFGLHFARFGGVLLKVVYFVLSIITCFMIISGVLIWRTARDNKQYTFEQRLFHHRVTKWYLAICLGMFPAFALIFIANKLVPMDLEGRVSIVNSIFFLGWLAMTILGVFWNKYSQQNRNYLIIGGVLSFLVPIINGLVTGDWIWSVIGHYEWVAYVDIFWLFSGVTALYLAFFVLKVKPTTDKPEKIEGTEQEKDAKRKKVALQQPAPILKIRPSLK